MHGSMDNILGFLTDLENLKKRNILIRCTSYFLIPTVIFAATIPLGDFNVGVVGFCFFLSGQHSSGEEIITPTARP